MMPPVYLFRNTVVKAAVSCFHMKDRYLPPSRHDRRKGAVRVAEDQDPVRACSAARTSSTFVEDLAGLLAKRFGRYAEMNVGRADLEIA